MLLPLRIVWIKILKPSKSIRPSPYDVTRR
jgi:hypothetical protein